MTSHPDNSAYRSGSQMRVLAVFGIVLRDGPISLPQIAQAASVSVSAAHRALQNLENSGLVQSLGGAKGYIATCAAVESACSARIGCPFSATVKQMMRSFRHKSLLYVDMVVCDVRGIISLVHSSDPNIDPGRPVSLAHNEGARTAVAAMPSAERATFLRAYLGNETSKKRN